MLDHRYHGPAIFRLQTLVILSECIDYMASHPTKQGWNIYGLFRLYGARVENDGDGQNLGSALTTVRSSVSVYTLTDSTIQAADILDPCPRPIPPPNSTTMFINSTWVGAISHPITHRRTSGYLIGSFREIRNENPVLPNLEVALDSETIRTSQFNLFLLCNRSESRVRNSTVCRFLRFFVSNLTTPLIVILAALLRVHHTRPPLEARNQQVKP